MHYTANVCRIDSTMAMGSIVPTDETHEKLDESRAVIDFFLTTEGRWKASRFYNPRTNDRGMVPDYFSPAQEIYAALDAAWCKVPGSQHGVASHNFEVPE